MVNIENKFYQFNSGIDPAVEQRLKILSQLGLLEAETIPVFEAATQTTADFLEVPICILGFIDQKYHWFKSAVGLSRLGLMNQLATTRSLPKEDSFCTHVVESQQVLTVSDTHNDPAFNKSVLVQRYGIRAYLGVPLMFAEICLGAIAVMDLQPRTFTNRDIKFLELVASWSISEFERSRLLKAQTSTTSSVPTLPVASNNVEAKITVPSLTNNDQLFAIQVKLELLAQLTQELRTPLTSVLGMANVVGREIYGPLTSKQKEYIEIIQNSGQYLLSMVNEISELGSQDESSQKTLNLTSVDLEMLCQQVFNTLSDAANRRDQQIRLSLEPGLNRIWVLDKDKVRHLLYHLIFSVIQSATTSSVIHLHLSHKADKLNLTVSTSHPWLGAGLTQIDPYFHQSPVSYSNSLDTETYPTENLNQDSNQPYSEPELPTLPLPDNQPLDLHLLTDIATASEAQFTHINSRNSQEQSQLYRSCESLRLLLSCHLAKLHGGQISVQGTAESGYRYLVSLPQLPAAKESL